MDHKAKFDAVAEKKEEVKLRQAIEKKKVDRRRITVGKKYEFISN